MSAQKTSFWRLVAFASPAYISGAILFPVISIIPTFYAREFGLSLALIGTILTCGRIFDAVTDPLTGYLSDITKSPIGRRKPWILGGFLLAMVSVYHLFIPGKDVGLLYFTIWFFMIYLAFTIIDIPHRAWATEISRHYNERSRISTYVGAAIQIGSMTFAIIPLIPIFASGGYNTQTLKFIAIYFIVLMPVIALVTILFAPDSQPIATRKSSVKTIFRSIKGNKPFWFFLATYSVGGLGNGIFYGLIYLFCDSYLHIGHLFPYIMIADAGATFISLPIWLKIMKKFGKHKSWAVGNALGGIVLIAMIFFKPGPSLFPIFITAVVLRSLFMTCVYVVPTAMLGDVIDYDILKTGANRSANYFSALTFIAKLNSAMGTGLGFIIIGALGYTVAGPNSAFANAGFVGTAFVLPAFLKVIASSLLWFFPIDHHRQSIIRRRIEARAQRAKRDGLEVG